jgi:tetratricopeptide (TPR) repeat protein
VAGKNGGGVVTAGGALGERVRTARKALGMSQAQLAGDELTKGFISQLESGIVRPSIRSLQIIATRLGKPLEYFLGDEPLATGKRVAFYLLAAEAALEQEQWDGVREHAEKALREAPPATERARLLYLLGRVAAAARNFERTFELVAEALSLVTVEEHAHLVARLLSLRGLAYGESGQLVAANEAYEAARDIIERYEVLDPRLRAIVMMSLGTVYRRLKRTGKAITAYESALAIASRSSQLVIAGRGHMGMAAAHFDSGDLDSAIASYGRALEMFRRASDIELELGALQSIANAQLENGEIETAKVSAQRAMQRSLEVGNSRIAAIVEVILGRIALGEGRAEEAMRMAKHAEKILGELGDTSQQADANGAMAAAAEALGRHGEADRLYRRSLDLYTKVSNFADRSGMAAEYARVLKARGQIDAAFDMLELARGGVTRR